MNKLYNFIPKDSALRQLDGSQSLFKKQLIRFGDWVDPNFPDERMRIDFAVLDAFVRNFDAGYVGRISVPLGHPRTPAELAELNKGELMKLTIEGDGSKESDGLYGHIDIRDPQTAADIREGRLFDVSILFTDNYQDTESGMSCGPAIVHVGLVNNPYIKKMTPFAALAEDLKGLLGSKVQVRSLSESANSNQETVMSKIKNERDFAVEVTCENGDKDVLRTRDHTATRAPNPHNVSLD